MERVTPIHVLEYGIRRRGVFLLVDVRSRKLWFYGYKTQAVMNRMIDSVKGRNEEMVNFLIARASVRGETK
jgi:hypothetical protein